VSWAYTHVERVRFGDLDAMRHLNNVVFLRYFETARILYMRELLPDHDPSHPEGGFGLIFAECQIAYRSPGYFDEVVAIDLRVADVRRSSFRIEFRMHVGERALADGSGTLVGYEYEHQRAARLPEDLRERLERVSKPSIG
jgi:acyl-CoA thioester hydrolase